jgi:hypothetical protein
MQPSRCFLRHPERDVDLPGRKYKPTPAAAPRRRGRRNRLSEIAVILLLRLVDRHFRRFEADLALLELRVDARREPRSRRPRPRAWFITTCQEHALSGVMVSFADPSGTPTVLTATDANGVATATVEAGSSLVIASTGAALGLIYVLGIQPGSSCTRRAPRSPCPRPMRRGRTTSPGSSSAASGATSGPRPSRAVPRRFAEIDLGTDLIPFLHDQTVAAPSDASSSAVLH